MARNTQNPEAEAFGSSGRRLTVTEAGEIVLDVSLAYQLVSKCAEVLRAARLQRVLAFFVRFYVLLLLYSPKHYKYQPANNSRPKYLTIGHSGSDLLCRQEREPTCPVAGADSHGATQLQT